MNESRYILIAIRILLIIFLISVTSNSEAGMCLNKEKEYIENILKFSPDTEPGQEKKTLLSSLLCLYFYVEYMDMAYDKPLPIKTGDVLSDAQKPCRLMKIIPYLKNPSIEVSCTASAALAYHGCQESYDVLIGCNKVTPDLGYYGATDERQRRMKSILLASLGDKRAVPWIISEFERMNRRYRKKPQFAVQAKLTFLNSLNVLAAKESLPFLRKVEREDQFQEVRERAKDAILHIEKLHSLKD